LNALFSSFSLLLLNVTFQRMKNTSSFILLLLQLFIRRLDWLFILNTPLVHSLIIIFKVVKRFCAFYSTNCVSVCVIIIRDGALFVPMLKINFLRTRHLLKCNWIPLFSKSGFYWSHFLKVQIEKVLVRGLLPSSGK
jgi:hypothetical protein